MFHYNYNTNYTDKNKSIQNVSRAKVPVPWRVTLDVEFTSYRLKKTKKVLALRGTLPCACFHTALPILSCPTAIPATLVLSKDLGPIMFWLYGVG